MEHGPSLRPAPNRRPAPLRGDRRVASALARVSLGALLALAWHAPLPAQDGRDAPDGPGDSVALDASDADAGRSPAVVLSETVLFAFGASGASDAGGDALDAFAARLAADGALRVRVDAHTDNVGWALGNVELSRLRARAIARGLIDRGVDVARITARAFGESAPVASNATAEGRRRNRRVELALLR